MTLTAYPVVYGIKNITPAGIVCDINALKVSVTGADSDDGLPYEYGGWNNGKDVLVPFEKLSGLLTKRETAALRWLNKRAGEKRAQTMTYRIYKNALNRHNQKVIAQASESSAQESASRRVGK